MKQAGMQEISAEVYNMNVFEASAYRKDRDKNPPIPGTIVPSTPTTPPEKGAEEPPKEQTDELPKNLHIPLTPEGKPETYMDTVWMKIKNGLWMRKPPR